MSNERKRFTGLEEALATKYVTIETNESEVLYFLDGFNTITGKKRTGIAKGEYKGEPVEKAHFEVIAESDLREGKITEDFVKSFNVGKRSARLILPKLQKGDQLLRIEKTGEKKETLYSPSVIENSELLELVRKHKAKLDTLQPMFSTGNGEGE